MNDNMLLKIAADLKIYKFCNENNEQFCFRVIYSAMALWMKAIALDGIPENPTQPHSVSKKYHTERSLEVLKTFISYFPYITNLFFDDEVVNDALFPIHELQNRLLLNGELLEMGFTNRFILAPFSKENIFKHLVLYRGLSPDKSYNYNGVSSVIFDNLIIEKSNSLLVDSTDFLEKVLLSCNYNDDNWSNKEYFNPFAQTDTFYKSWESKPPNQEVYISRVESGIKQYRYFLEKRHGSQIKVSKLDNYLIESGQLLRLLLILRYKVDNPIVVKMLSFSDHFEIKRFARSFAYPEETMLRAFGWPKKSISDTLDFSYHNCMKPLIKQVLENLKIKIEEVSYE